MSKSRSTDNHLKLNYKLKDNPFVAGDLAQVPATTPLMVTRERTSNPPSTTLLTTTPATGTPSTETKRHVRASVMRMAASNTVSSNPWKTKLGSMADQALTPLSKTIHLEPKTVSTDDDPAVLGVCDGLTTSAAIKEEETEGDMDRGGSPEIVVVEAEGKSQLQPFVATGFVPLPSGDDSDDGSDDETPKDEQVDEQQTRNGGPHLLKLGDEEAFVSIRDVNKVDVGATTANCGNSPTQPLLHPPTNTTMAHVTTTMEHQVDAVAPLSCDHDHVVDLVIDPSSSSSSTLLGLEEHQGFLHIDTDDSDDDQSDDDDDEDDDAAAPATPDDSSVSEDDDNSSSSRHHSAATEFTVVGSIDSSLTDRKTRSTFNSIHSSSSLGSVIKVDGVSSTPSPSSSPLPHPKTRAEVPWNMVTPPLPPRADSSDSILPDMNVMLQQLAESQAAVAATHFSAHGFLDTEKWLHESARAQRTAEYLHERLKVETHAQRAIAAVLKLKAEKKDRVLASDLQSHARAIDTMVDSLVSTLSCAYNANYTPSIRTPPSEEIIMRLKALAGVSPEEPMGLDALVSRLEQQKQQEDHPPSIHPTPSSTDDVAQKLKETEDAFKAAQQEFTQREAALMLQSASVEAELVSVVKEYERVTRNIADFNNERKKYDAEIAKLTRERHTLDKQLVDAKIKWGIGKDGQTQSLRKEFRQLMAAVKDEHMDAMQKEVSQRKAVESVLRSLRHELEVKRWDRVDTGVQTHFVYNSTN